MARSVSRSRNFRNIQGKQLRRERSEGLGGEERREEMGKKWFQLGFRF